MAFYEWNESLSVGFFTIDSQHKHLIRLVNSLYDAMGAGKSKEIMQKLIKDLVSYTKIHFADEEELMKKNGYPEYQRQKSEHDMLTQQVIKFSNDYNSGKSVVSITMMNFLKDWLNNHIIKEDRKLGEFLKNK